MADQTASVPTSNPTPPPSNPEQSPVPNNPPAEASRGTIRDLDQSLRDAFSKEGVQVDDHLSNLEDEVKPESQQKEEVTPSQEQIISEASKKEDDGEAPVDPETIAPPQNISKKAAESWNVVKKNSTRAWNALKRATEENNKLKKLVAEKSTQTSSEVEQMKKELEDLRGLRATVDYEHDPEFIKQYEAPIEKIENQMREMLQGLDVAKEVIDQIDYSDPGVISRVSQVLAEKVDNITANRFLKRGEEAVDLHEKRENALSEFKGKHKQYYEERRKKMENASVEEVARMTKQVDDIAEAKDEKGNYTHPFLAKLEVPLGAKRDEAARYEQHNKMVEQNRALVDRFLKVNDPEGKAKIVCAAVGGIWLEKMLETANGKIKSLEDTLKKYNDISSERTGVGSETSHKAPASGDLDDALSAAFPTQFRRTI